MAMLNGSASAFSPDQQIDRPSSFHFRSFSFSFVSLAFR